MDNARDTFRGFQWIGIVLTLSIGLALLALWALRPESSHGAVGTNDPTANQVFQVAVDTDTTGNPTGSGGTIPSLQSTTASIPIGTTHFIDVIVDEVDASNGMLGFGFDLKYDQNVVEIVSKNPNSYMLTGGIDFSAGGEPLPDKDGNWRTDVGWIGGPNISGEGVLTRIGVKCIANGTSPLDLADDIGGDGIPDIIDMSFAAITVLNATDGEIVCGTGGTATPTPDPGTATPTPDPATATPTPDPATATPTPDPGTATPTPDPGTATPTPDPGTATPTPDPGTATPTATPAASASATPTPTATATPSASPSSTATPGRWTEAPAPTPTTDTATPTPAPTAGPSLVWGDANCSGSTDPVDALLTLQHDAGLLGTNTGDCPGLGETIDVLGASLHPWGDVDCSGSIDPVDSLKLLRSDAGLSVPQGAGCPEIGSTVLIG